MKKILALLSIIVGIFTFANAKNYALITGVPSGFSYNAALVEGIKIDMALMKGLFESYGYEIKVLEDPTPSELRKALKSYQKLTPGDNFVFFYSGHGASIDDKNGDESDGKDETLVLKDNELFVDDELYLYLSKINSKKFVFFDSCHSGTAFKSLSLDTRQPQGGKFSKSLGYISNPKGVGVTEIEPVAEDEIASLLFFGAAKDNEYAQAGEKGSLYTVSVNEALKREKADMNDDGKIKFSELEKFTALHIKKLCRNLGYRESDVHTPQMHTESFNKEQDAVHVLKSMIGNNSSGTLSQLEREFDTLIDQGMADPLRVSAKSTYKDGDRIQLTIDTEGMQGYLYLIYVDPNEYTLLYPNKFSKESQQVSGSIQFPAPKFGRFSLTAQKPYGRTVVYTILSQEPLDLYDKNSNEVFNIFGLNSNKSLKVLSEVSFRGIGVKSSDLLLGKTVFTVNP